MLQVAILGAGNIGRIRAAVIQSSERASVRWVADIDAQAASRLAGTVGAKVALDWRDAVNDPQVDVVVVCTPTKFHLELAKAALDAGKHVLCEKPLSRSVAEADLILLAAAKAGRVLKTGFNYRHMAHVRKAKEILDRGGIGPVYYLRCQYGHGGRPGYEKAWCTDLDLSGGGVLLEQGIHILDLVRYLVGEPVEALSQSARFFWNFPAVEDNSFVQLRTEAGQIAQIHISWTQWKNVFNLELFGQDGYLVMSGRDGHYGSQQLVWGVRQENHGRPKEETFQFDVVDASWRREWEEFEQSIAENREPLGNGQDGLRAIALVEAAYESAKLGAWVAIDEGVLEASTIS